MLAHQANKKFQKGFTLIEVMAAVAVFAISAAGLYSINQQTVITADHLERKTVAHWIAMNHYNQLTLDSSLTYVGEKNDTEKMLNIEWNITTKFLETRVSSVKRVVIAVSDNSGKQLAQINGFVGENKAVSHFGFPQ